MRLTLALCAAVAALAAALLFLWDRNGDLRDQRDQAAAERDAAKAGAAAVTASMRYTAEANAYLQAELEELSKLEGASDAHTPYTRGVLDRLLAD